jgi:hypothetical protein
VLYLTHTHTLPHPPTHPPTHTHTQIIHHVNADGRVNVFYSTPVEYTAAKYAENITWPVKTDDFMPLANDAHSVRKK